MFFLCSGRGFNSLYLSKISFRGMNESPLTAYMIKGGCHGDSRSDDTAKTGSAPSYYGKNQAAITITGLGWNVYLFIVSSNVFRSAGPVKWLVTQSLVYLL